VVFGAAVAGGIAWYVITTPAGPGSGPPPVIAADPTPYKQKPADPGGMEVADQDKLVYERVTQNSRPPPVENLLPPPEQVKPPPPAPTPVPSPPPASSAPTPAPAAPVAATPASAPASAPAQAPDELTAIVEAMRKQMDAQQAATAAVANTAAGLEAAPGESTPAAAVPPAPMAAGAFLVQLAAARSEDAARAEWSRLSGKHKDVLGSLSPTVERADLGERGVFFRLKAGPLADRAQADAVCAAMKAQDDACLVVKP
jgi:hypothetical protein